MKITENYLKKIIKEERKKLLSEEVTEQGDDYVITVNQKPMQDKGLERTAVTTKARTELAKKLSGQENVKGSLQGASIKQVKQIANGQYQVRIPKEGVQFVASQETPAASTTPVAAAPATPAPVQSPITQAPAPQVATVKPTLQPNSKVKHKKSGTTLTFVRAEGDKAYVTDGTRHYKVNIASLTPELQESKIFKTSYVQQVIKEETTKFLKEMKIKFNKGSLEELDMYKAKEAYRGGLEGAKQGLNVGPAMAGPQIGGLVGAAIGGASGAYNAYKAYDANQQNLKKAYTRQMDDYYSRTAMSDPDNPPVDPDIGGISGASLPKPTPKPVVKPMPKPAPKPVAKPPPATPTEPPDEVFEPENYLQVQGKGKLRFKPQK
jgi:hypothetical protein